jgi:hypothetical protein
MSPGRRTPTQKESRSFGKGASVPFETLPRALDYGHGMCGSHGLVLGGIGRSRGTGGRDDSLSRLLFMLGQVAFPPMEVTRRLYPFDATPDRR